jgi:hypothetical protein
VVTDDGRTSHEAEPDWKAIVTAFLDMAGDDGHILRAPATNGPGGDPGHTLGYRFAPGEMKALEDLVGYWIPMTDAGFRELFKDEPTIEVRDGEARKKPDDDWAKPTDPDDLTLARVQGWCRDHNYVLVTTQQFEEMLRA